MKTIAWLEYLPVFILVLAFALVQFSQSLIIGADGFLHGRLSLLVAENGFLKSIPQAYFSWFNTGRFADKDFLYHLYLLPFVKFADYLPGVKLGALTAISILGISVFKLLRLYAQSKIIPWLSLGLLLSSQFLRDTAEARPFVFAIVFTLWGIYKIIQKQFLWIFLISLVYGMTHLSAWILPVFAIFYSVVNWIKSGKGEGMAIVYSLVGYMLSFLIHPNFPQNIFYFYLNGILVPIYAARTGVLELGAEFFPLYTHELIRLFPLIIFGLIMIFTINLGKNIKNRADTFAWGLALIFFAFMSLFARKNLTHLYPVFLIWFGLSLDDWLTSMRQEAKKRKVRIYTSIVIAGILVNFFSIWQIAVNLKQTLYVDKVYGQHFFKIVQAIKQKIPAGQRIFHTNWSDSQYLIGLAPDYQYLVTLDPIYMYSYNKNLYQLYRQVSFGQTSDPDKVLHDVFQTNYAYAGKNYFNSFIYQIKNSNKFRIIFEDDLGVLFALVEQK